MFDETYTGDDRPEWERGTGWRCVSEQTKHVIDDARRRIANAIILANDDASVRALAEGKTAIDAVCNELERSLRPVAGFAPFRSRPDVEGLDIRQRRTKDTDR
jgi:hypothetical protein